jgi:lipopolysaccharide biosynthesis glycosyltransferase
MAQMTASASDISAPLSKATFSLAYVTDAGLFRPTLISAWSALRSTLRPLTVRFVGVSLSEKMWQDVERLQLLFPTSKVERIDLPPDWLANGSSRKSFITSTALGRMFLPRLMMGRVLYIDGDTLVTGDLAAAAKVNLGGLPIAGVRDFSMMRWRARGQTQKMKAQADLLGWSNGLENYVNSGVLLMDCDAIRSSDATLLQMEDLAAAARFPTVDQDRINEIFEGRMAHLDPAWNASWGRVGLQRRDTQSLPVLAAADRPLIVHFHGPNKPWQPLRLSTLKKGALATLRYRWAMATFEAELQHIL